MMNAVIFDLDGTILDNTSFHMKAWFKFLEDRNIKITKEEFMKNIYGRTNTAILKHVFGKGISKEKIGKYAYEKEALYRELYEAHIEPLAGFTELVDELKKNKIPIGMATSAPKANWEMAIERLGLQKTFDAIVGGGEVKNSKPYPDIYLHTAELLNVKPDNCLVFEDSTVGIEAAKNAGMKCIAVLTSYKKEELSKADRFVTDFMEADMEFCKSLFG